MKLHTYLAVAGMAAALSLGTSALAQDNGGGGGRRFDPAQIAQMRLDRAKESLEITDDTEWKAIEPLVQKVQDAQMAVMADRMGGMRGMFGGRRRGGNDNGDQGGGNNNNGGRRGFGPPPSPESEALQKAIDAKASKAELSSALDRYIAARKAKQAALESAEENLRKVLTKRQEALAVLHGLL